MAEPIKLPSGNWRIQIRMAGLNESATFPTKTEAKIWAQKRSTEIRKIRRGEIPDKTLAQLLERYMEEESPKKKGHIQERFRIKRMMTMLPISRLVMSLTSVDISNFKNMRAKSVAPASVNKELAVLSTAFDIARREWKWMGDNPCKDVHRMTEPHHRERIISDDEIVAVCKALGYTEESRIVTVGQQVAVCFLLALETGMRAGEICRLTWNNVYEDYVHLPDTKAGIPRNVALTKQAVKLINKMRGVNSPNLFYLSPPTLDAYFRKYKKMAGLEGFTFHDTRHTAATRLAPKLPLLDLCKMFGWLDPKRAMTYYNPTASDIAKRLNI